MDSMRNPYDIYKVIISELWDNAEFAIFRLPVDYLGLGLHDYKVIVKHPMDFSTIKKKIKNFKYRSSRAFIHDLELVYKNCKAYNQEGSQIYLLALSLEEQVNKKIRHAFGKKEISRRPSPPPIEQCFQIHETKIQELNHIMRKLNQEEMLAIARIVKEKNPENIEVLDHQTFRIMFRNLPLKLFDEILQFSYDMRKEQSIN